MHHELRFFANTWKDSYWPAALFFMDLLNNLIYVLYMYKVYLFILQVKKKKNMYLKLRQDPELHVYF